MKYSANPINYAVLAALCGALWACDNDPAKGKVKASVSAAAEAAPAEPAEPAAKPEQAAKYAFNSQGSKLGFIGAKVTDKHEGSFGEFSGEVSLTDGDPTKGSVVVEIDMSSISIEPEKLEGHLKSADFFDVEKHPKAKFQSTTIKRGGPQGATHTVTGNLTLRGVTKAVTFPATIKVDDKTVGVDAEFAINRKDFEIVYPGMPDDLIKDNVLIKIDLNAKPGKA